MSRTLFASVAVHVLAVTALVLASTSVLVSAGRQAPAPASVSVARMISADEVRLSAQIRLLAENVDALDSMPLTLPPAR